MHFSHLSEYNLAVSLGVSLVINADMIAMRREYTALIMVADGLLAIVRASAACNIHTMARIAAEARAAARELASLIERMIYELLPRFDNAHAVTTYATAERNVYPFGPRYRPKPFASSCPHGSRRYPITNTQPSAVA
jgi:hypothetical protein